ncbi:uncharacterized protein [Lepeophtheirus salmonis]|uniref:uncharacterized protein n=1 Tax=Lepeophtheirus salmonis TaxID=72036 RepID=UPI001AE94F1C|nr:uncharacterized protein LOC121116873 [Lepeophtheirus salmonis]
MVNCGRGNEEKVIYSSESLNEDSMGKILSNYCKTLLEVKEFDGLQCSSNDEKRVNDNFQSDILFISVTTKDGEVFHIVSKESLTYSSRFLSWLQTISRPFYKECIWYRIALPLLSQLWPIVKELSPKCYYGEVNTGLSLIRPISLKYFGLLGYSLVAKSEKSLILLENVCKRLGDGKFETINKMNIIDFDFALSAMRTMAHFHGIWRQFLYGGKTPREPNTSPQDFLNIFQPKLSSYGMKSFIGRITLMIINLLCNNVEGGVELAERYKRYSKSEEIINLHIQMFTNPSTEKSKLKTMIHGDYWTNNLLYRPSDKFTMMIDYQIMQIAHPARDFWYFIYSSTDRQWRELYLEQCKRTYYDIYCSYADTNQCLTYEQLSKELEDRRGIGIFIPFMTILITKYPEQIDKQHMVLFGKDYDKVIKVIGQKEKEDDHPNIKKMRHLFIDAVQEAADLGLIK